MFKNFSIVGIIPARKGSRGLPGKNVKMLAGKPLIAWTAEQASQSRYLDRVIVTTDDAGIARIASGYGAQAPFLRPEKLATSTAKMADVLLHAVEYLRKQGYNYKFIVLLQPTSPLRGAPDIDRAIELFFRKKAGAVVSVCECEHHPRWSYPLSAGGKISGSRASAAAAANRQELPRLYRPNGAVYVAETNYLKKHNGFLGGRTYGYVMPQERSVDIDNIMDFKFAEFLMAGKK